MRTGSRFRRMLVALGVATAVAISGAIAAPGAAPSAEAAVASEFNPGNIISDSAFYSTDAMSAGQVQAFLDAQVPVCRATAGNPTCLRYYAQATAAQPADQYCNGYGAVYHTAAQIIEGVQRSCGISARAMLVLLQKEQGLITSTAPSIYSYRAATGMGCPDTAPCDSAFYGFFYQVYMGARQLKKYLLNPSAWRYKPYQNNYVQYHPNAGCGGTTIYIQNAATAGLYNYTPYQPDQYALANLYGTGRDCSSYGNRNFWRMYTDWFGSTGGFNLEGGIGQYYIQKGGANGTGLGEPTGNQYMVDRAANTWVQYFRFGQVYWTPSIGAKIVAGGIAISYDKLGGPTGSKLGYPTGEQIALPDGRGWRQDFQNGAMYWTSTSGGVTVQGRIGTYYTQLGSQTSDLGYPLDEPVTTGIGTMQRFEKGTVVMPAAVAASGQRIPTELYSWIETQGGLEQSRLGLPTASASLRDTGLVQSFVRGSVYTTATGIWSVVYPISTAYTAAGGTTGGLGYPNGAGYMTDSTTTVQSFENGIVYDTRVGGSRAVIGATAVAYAAAGGPNGSGLGYPTGALSGTRQAFEYGYIDGSTITITDATRRAYYANGGPQGPLGTATAARVSIGDAAGGWYDTYQNGRVYGATGIASHRVGGGIGLAYTAAGGPRNGNLGYPVTEQHLVGDKSGGWVQGFQNGEIYWSPSSGANIVTGEIGRQYRALGGPVGSQMGYPTGAEFAANGAQVQRFTYGSAYYSATTGARFVYGGIQTEYVRLGSSLSSLGLPISGQFMPTGAAWEQRFQRGTIIYTGATGSVSMQGAVASWYTRWGGLAATVLGAPKAPQVVKANGTVQYFQNGRVDQLIGTAPIASAGGIQYTYNGLGASSSYLGFPLGAQYQLADGGWVQIFQNGRIWYSSATGGWATSGGVGAEYALRGGPSGTNLGYPIQAERSTGPGTSAQGFQRGWMEWVGRTLIHAY